MAASTSRRWAKEQGWDIEAALNMTLLAATRARSRITRWCGYFSEGLPAAATEQEIRRIRGLGGENDSASRQLARYIADVGRAYDAGVKPMLVFRLDRYLRGATILHSTSRDLPRCDSRNFARNFHHQHQNVRSEGGIEYGDIPKFVDYDLCGATWRG